MIPDRWLACPQHSTLIADKFVVFKVPLDNQYDSNVGTLKFDFNVLHKSLKDKKLQLKMVVDLTFTDRFYNSKQLTDKNIHYVKIKCRGKDEAPDTESKNKFIEEVKKFEGGDGDVIGVHCTHGFNRSGFMVISYLVEEYDFCLDSAVVQFSQHRYPGIYKEDYIQRLCKVYNMDRSDVPPITNNLPSWVTDKKSNERPEIYNSSKIFSDGMISGVDTVVDMPKVLAVQKAVQKICKWDISGFPGGQPVSLSRNNIQKLSEMEYRVSWKADGTRYLMYIEKANQVYLLDRDNTVFKPRSLIFPYENAHLHSTLLDGELVIDKYEMGSIPRFMAYDIITLQNEDVGSKSLDERQECIRNIVNERDYRIDKSNQAFSVKLKQFYDVKDTRKLMSKEFLKTIYHKTDGLIFQPANKPYLTGKCEDILKWKPPTLNTIDFRLKIEKETLFGGLPRTVANLYCSDTRVEQILEFKSLKGYDNKIVECYWDYNWKRWKFMRERTDKSFPNAYETYASIFKTIREPVTLEYLVDFITTKRTAQKALEDPPASKRHKSMK